MLLPMVYNSAWMQTAHAPIQAVGPHGMMCQAMEGISHGGLVQVGIVQDISTLQDMLPQGPHQMQST